MERITDPDAFRPRSGQRRPYKHKLWTARLMARRIIIGTQQSNYGARPFTISDRTQRSTQRVEVSPPHDPVHQRFPLYIADAVLERNTRAKNTTYTTKLRGDFALNSAKVIFNLETSRFYGNARNCSFDFFFKFFSPSPPLTVKPLKGEPASSP